ncbi:MAG: beta-galactosidase, partial [Bacteroidetes bacterium]|nr:beta-galactosidase [Bacteroidota bacterium]
MKRILLLALITIAAINLFAQDWKPAGDKIKTEWAEKVDPNNPLPEYPRPQLVRNSWKNLNGLWNYAILPKGGNIPESFDGKILVPFAIESSLSGVQKRVGKNNELWYQQSLSIPKEWKNKNIVLHFGGVDWKADIWLNDIKIGSHQGGYTPFSFDITPFLNKSGDQKLLVKVWDPTSDGYQPRGKQVVKPGGIFYTPVSGIWQTVWLEAVNTCYVSQLKTIPNIDGQNICVNTCLSGSDPADIVLVNVLDDGKIISTGKAAAGQEVLIAVPDAKLWTPESPFLYDMEVEIIRKGKA